MKNIIALLLLIASFSVLANNSDDAIEAFQNSKEVQEIIKTTEIRGLGVEGEPQAAFLSGGCGYGGCSYRYLVTITVATKYRVNNQLSSIGAIVELIPVSKSKVTVIDTKKIR